MDFIDIYVKCNNVFAKSEDVSKVAILIEVKHDDKTIVKEYVEEFTGSYNALILQGIIFGIKKIKPQNNINVHAKNKAMIELAESGVIETWQRKGWKKRNGAAVANVGLWQQILVLKNLQVLTFDGNIEKYAGELNRMIIAKR